MSKELIIDTSSSDVNIALLEDKKLVELNKEKSNPQFAVGDIYLGKVKKLMPGLNAAFVDVGEDQISCVAECKLGGVRLRASERATPPPAQLIRPSGPE